MPTYEVNGHDIKIMDRSSISLFIDGDNINWDEINKDEIPDQFYPTDHTVESVKRLTAFLIDTNQRICGKCGSVFENGTGGTYPFAGIQCKVCDNKDKFCPDGEKHSFKVLNPRQKNNARVATKRKCRNCGYRKDSPTTG